MRAALRQPQPECHHAAQRSTARHSAKKASVFSSLVKAISLRCCSLKISVGPRAALSTMMLTLHCSFNFHNPQEAAAQLSVYDLILLVDTRRPVAPFGYE